jgi:predicted DNA-binding transcriptional regulator YafY
MVKIILESRSLNKKEMDDVVESLLDLLSKEEQKEVREIIQNEWFNYQEPTNAKDRIDKIWEISEYIRTQTVIEMDYQNSIADNSKTHKILPVSLYFDNFYFYVIGFNEKWETYTMYRVDRIVAMRATTEKIKIEYAHRFQDGDKRKVRQYAFRGEVIRLKLAFSNTPEVVLDQFPNSKLIEQLDEGWNMFEVEAEDTAGLMMWVLSQGEWLKVIEPKSFVEKLKRNIDVMKGYYQ